MGEHGGEAMTTTEAPPRADQGEEAMTLRQHLQRLKACSEALEWVGDRDLEQAWAECHRGDWMLWLAGRVGAPRSVEVARACAERANTASSDQKRDWAIDSARRWARGETDLEEVEAASAASAYTAASAAAYTAANAAYYNTAGNAATAAAAYTAAWAASLADSARLVRERIPVAVVRNAFTEKEKP